VGYYFHDVNICTSTSTTQARTTAMSSTATTRRGRWYTASVQAQRIFQHLNAKIEYERMEIDEVDEAYVLWLTVRLASEEFCLQG
jgi:hypothetical protein